MENNIYKLRSQKAFSLAEVVIAIFVIGITTTASFLMTTSSIRSQIVGQDYSIAISLAREGLEVVRGIRDTNWLRYSGSRRAASGDPGRDHWNDGFDGVDTVTPVPNNDYNSEAVGLGNTLTEDENYTIVEASNYFVPVWDYNNVDLDLRYVWGLKFIDNNDLDDDGDDPDELYPTTDEYLVHTTSTGLYIQNGTGTPPALGESTKFYRVIDIRYQESYDQPGTCVPDADGGDGDTLADEDPPGDYDGDGNDDDDNDGTTDEDGFDGDCKLNANDNIVLVRSKVIWLDNQGNQLNVDLSTTLTDWFRREDHT